MRPVQAQYLLTLLLCHAAVSCGWTTGAHEDASLATVGGLEQGYVVCPSDKRFLLLFTFLKRNKSKKIMVRIPRQQDS